MVKLTGYSENFEVQVLGYDPQHIKALDSLMEVSRTERYREARIKKETEYREINGGINLKFVETKGSKGHEDSDAELREREIEVKYTKERLAKEIAKRLSQEGETPVITHWNKGFTNSPKQNNIVTWFLMQGIFIPWRDDVIRAGQIEVKKETPFPFNMLARSGVTNLKPLGDILLTEDGNWYNAPQIFLVITNNFKFLPEDQMLPWRAIKNVYAVACLPEEFTPLWAINPRFRELKLDRIYKAALLWVIHY